MPLSSCINDFETCDCIFKSEDFASLEAWFFNSMQFSGLADRSLEMGGGDGLHPNNFLTESFNSGVLRGGRASVALIASFASLLLVVTERSSGWRRPSGDGGSSTLLPSTLDGSWTDSRVAAPTSGQPLPVISFSAPQFLSKRLSKEEISLEWNDGGRKFVSQRIGRKEKTALKKKRFLKISRIYTIRLDSRMFEMFGGRLNSGRMLESIRKVVSWSVKLQRVCFQIEDSPTVCLTIILEIEETRSRYSWGQIVGSESCMRINWLPNSLNRKNDRIGEICWNFSHKKTRT